VAEPRWRTVSDAIQRIDPELSAGERVCLAGERLMDAASLSIAAVTDLAYRPFASSSTWAAQLDEVQFSVGDGPTFQAQGTPSPVLAEDLHGHESTVRWPIFVGAAAQEGVVSAFAFPLRVGAGRLGVLTAYRKVAGALGAQQFADGLILATFAGAEIVRVLAVEEQGLTEEPDPGAYDQTAVNFAAGMVAEQLGTTIVDALVRIRAYAFAHDLTVTDVARLIADRQIMLER